MAHMRKWHVVQPLEIWILDRQKDWGDEREELSIDQAPHALSMQHKETHAHAES